MILEIQSLSRNFGGLKAVDDVSLAVVDRTIQSVIGPNGAGKTTLFNLITGAVAPVAGTIRFQGEDVTGAAPERLARKGLVRSFQRTSIFRNLSVAENVQLAIRSRRGVNGAVRLARPERLDIEDEAQAMLTKVGLSGRERVTAGTLAHGSQRTLDIAIALALQPKLILMDEPMAGMSKGDRHRMADLIVKLRDEFGLTILLVEHDIGVVMQLSDVVTVMQTGRVIAEGPPQAIKENEDVKRAYLHGSFAA